MNQSSEDDDLSCSNKNVEFDAPWRFWNKLHNVGYNPKIVKPKNHKIFRGK